MGKKNSSSTLLWFFIILLFIAAGAILLFPVYKDLRRKQQELRTQQERLAERRAHLLVRQKEVNDLESSPDAVEKVAREHYHMIRENESVMYYNSDKLRKSGEK